MKLLAVLFALFAVIGLLIAIIGHAGKQASVAPSMVTNNMSPVGYTIAVVCGLIAAAAFAG